MPQTAIIQTAPQIHLKTSSASTPGRDFSPHLDKAISNSQDSPGPNDHLSNSQNIHGRKNGQQVDQALENTHPSHQAAGESAGFQNTDMAAAGIPDPFIQPDNPASTADILLQVVPVFVDQTISISQPDHTGQNSLQHKAPLKSPLFTFLANSPSGNGAQPNTLSTENDQTEMIPVEKSWTNAPVELKNLMSESTLLSTSEHSAPQSEKTAFLQQIKTVIGNSEAGKLSITVAGSNMKSQTVSSSIQTFSHTAATSEEPITAPLYSVQNTELDSESSMVFRPNGMEIPAEKSSRNPASIRQSIEQQYYEGKIAPDNKAGSQTAAEQNRQDSSFSAKPATGGEGLGSSAPQPEQTSTFSQPLALAQENVRTPAVEVYRPGALPAGPATHPEEVIRQLTEHFHIARRNLDTRVNIQLHPAELGKLEINLSVRGGTVRATVVAASQYTQEIIERNMTRLRATLESQGFTIDEILVTAKSDNIDDSSQFDRHLFSQNDYTPPARKNPHSQGAPFFLDDMIREEQKAATGVNVKI